MADVPSEELRMFVILLTANFKFRNRSTCSNGPMKRAGKVCGDSQDLKSPGRPFIKNWSDSFVLKGELTY